VKEQNGRGVKEVQKKKRSKRKENAPPAGKPGEQKEGSDVVRKKRGRKSKQGFCGKRGKGDRVGEEKASSTALTALARGTRTK